MFRLISTELRRLRKRAFFKAMVIGLLGVIALIAFTSWQSSKPVSDAELAESERYYQENLNWYNEAKANGDIDDAIASCEQDKIDNPDWYEPGFDCTEVWPEPQREDFIYRWITDYTSQAAGSTEAYSLVIFFAALLFAISFLTAEISTGAIGNWLTFEPNRTKVYWSKAIAAGIGLVATSAALMAVFHPVIRSVFTLNGAVGEDPAQAFGDALLVSGRALVAVAAGAVIGVAIGALTRHAALALGIMIGWLIGAEVMLSQLKPQLSQYLVLPNVQAWVTGRYDYYMEKCTVTADGRSCEYVTQTLYQAHGGWYLLIVAVALTLAAWLVFLRRDVN